MHHHEEQNPVYGETMRQRHRYCQNGVVLIQIGKASQCGIILACGDKFCYVLTTTSGALSNRRCDIVITFGDAKEKTFKSSDVVVEKSNTLSILIFRAGIETVQAKQPVRFSTQDDLEEALVYTLSFIPKVLGSYEGITVTEPACSYFRGGNAGVVGLEYRGADVFYHNCSTGHDVIEGSAVLKGNCDIIGINLEYSTGWTMALQRNGIRDEIAKIFPDTRNMTFADIKQYLEVKG